MFIEYAYRTSQDKCLFILLGAPHTKKQIPEKKHSNYIYFYICFILGHNIYRYTNILYNIHYMYIPLLSWQYYYIINILRYNILLWQKYGSPLLQLQSPIILETIYFTIFPSNVKLIIIYTHHTAHTYFYFLAYFGSSLLFFFYLLCTWFCILLMHMYRKYLFIYSMCLHLT